MDEKITDWQHSTAECAAAENVLPGESPDEYQLSWTHWFALYTPESEVDLLLLAAVVNAAWRVKRSSRSLLRLERALATEFPESTEWPRARMLDLSRMQRFHAGNESSFQRNLKLVEFMKSKMLDDLNRATKAVTAWHKDNQPEAEALIKAGVEVTLPNLLKFSAGPRSANPVAGQPGATKPASGKAADSAAKKRKKIVRLEQWVEVRCVDGQTTTQLYPSNAKLIERGRTMSPAPDFVYRRLNFPEGIPAEYSWVGVVNDEHRRSGGMGIQRMTMETWLALIEAEARTGDGHLLPTANLPRPEEHGGCDCVVCTRNREILEGDDDDQDLAA